MYSEPPSRWPLRRRPKQSPPRRLACANVSGAGHGGRIVDDGRRPPGESVSRPSFPRSPPSAAKAFPMARDGRCTAWSMGMTCSPGGSGQGRRGGSGSSRSSTCIERQHSLGERGVICQRDRRHAERHIEELQLGKKQAIITLAIRESTNARKNGEYCERGNGVGEGGVLCAVPGKPSRAEDRSAGRRTSTRRRILTRRTRITANINVISVLTETQHVHNLAIRKGNHSKKTKNKATGKNII